MRLGAGFKPSLQCLHLHKVQGTPRKDYLSRNTHHITSGQAPYWAFLAPLSFGSSRFQSGLLFFFFFFFKANSLHNLLHGTRYLPWNHLRANYLLLLSCRSPVQLIWHGQQYESKGVRQIMVHYLDYLNVNQKIVDIRFRIFRTDELVRYRFRNWFLIVLKSYVYFMELR